MTIGEIRQALACPSALTQQELLTWIGILLSKIEENNPIPPHDYMSATFYGVTNNYHVITYKMGGESGTTVLTITLEYLNGAVADNDVVSTLTRS